MRKTRKKGKEARSRIRDGETRRNRHSCAAIMSKVEKKNLESWRDGEGAGEEAKVGGTETDQRCLKKNRMTWHKSTAQAQKKNNLASASVTREQCDYMRSACAITNHPVCWASHRFCGPYVEDGNLMPQHHNLLLSSIKTFMLSGSNRYTFMHLFIKNAGRVAMEPFSMSQNV